MRKTYKYRIYPTKKQVHKLGETLSECRWLYNHLLEVRKITYEQTGKTLSLYQQQETFSLLKEQRPSLKGVHSQVLQNVAVRIDLAFLVQSGRSWQSVYQSQPGLYQSGLQQVPSSANDVAG